MHKSSIGFLFSRCEKAQVLVTVDSISVPGVARRVNNVNKTTATTKTINTTMKQPQANSVEG